MRITVAYKFFIFLIFLASTEHFEFVVKQIDLRLPSILITEMLWSANMSLKVVFVENISVLTKIILVEKDDDHLKVNQPGNVRNSSAVYFEVAKRWRKRNLKMSMSRRRVMMMVNMKRTTSSQSLS